MPSPENIEDSENFSPDAFYNFPENSEFQNKINEALQEIDDLRKRIDPLKPLRVELWNTIQEKLRIEWTYDSNAIEGSTLTLGETHFFLREGLTVHGKPFKDFLDAKNHAEAIDYLLDVVKNNRAISEGLIKELNALLLSGVTYVNALDQFGNPTRKPISPGAYKKQPNHVLQPDGTIHHYTDPLKVPDEMQNLVKWINAKLNTRHPIVTAAVAHYNLVRVHPFDDGNGRVARLLMNLILMQKGYPPAIIKYEQRPDYLAFLGHGDTGNLQPFSTLIADALIRTQKAILSDLNSAPKL